jgi:hypothetical protein
MLLKNAVPRQANGILPEQAFGQIRGGASPARKAREAAFRNARAGEGSPKGMQKTMPLRGRAEETDRAELKILDSLRRRG